MTERRSAPALRLFCNMDLSHQKGQSDHHRQRVRRRRGKPDAVQAPDQGKKQHRQALKHQRPQEGDQGGGQSVVQSGEEGRAEDRKP